MLVIEWPDRAGALLPADRLDVAFTWRRSKANTRTRITGWRFFVSTDRCNTSISRSNPVRPRSAGCQGDASAPQL